MTHEIPPILILDPNPCADEAEARGRLEYKRSQGEEIVMREIQGKWYTGIVIRTVIEEGEE